MYKCRDTLVSLGLKVDYTAERLIRWRNRYNCRHTYCVEARKVYLSAGTLLLLYQEVIYAADTLAAFG